MKKIAFIFILLLILILSGCVKTRVKIYEGREFVQAEDGHFYSGDDIIYQNYLNNYEILTFSFLPGTLTIYHEGYFSYSTAPSLSFVCQYNTCSGQLQIATDEQRDAFNILSQTFNSNRGITLRDIGNSQSFYRSLVFMVFSFGLLMYRYNVLEKRKLDKQKRWVDQEQKSDLWLKIFTILAFIGMILTLYFVQFI
jgi:hypothetical protein